MTTDLLLPYHLPGLPDRLPSIAPPGLEGLLSFPRLTPSTLASVLASVARAREEHLVKRPMAEIIAALDRTARRWLGPASRWRQAALECLAPLSVFSVEMIETAITSTFSALLEEPLEDLVTSELGSVRSRTVGPSLIVQIFSGNVPGVSVRSLAYGLLVRGASLGKMAGGEPLLAALFARSLAEVDPGIAETLAVTWWPGGEPELERGAFAAASDVVVYGGDETIRDVRSRLPTGVRFHPHGHKVSLAVVGRESLAPVAMREVADRLARDVALYDQQGCFSPQMVYVERGGASPPEEFARTLAEALERAAREIPRGMMPPEVGARLAQERSLHEMRGGTVFGTLLNGIVVWDPDPAPVVSPGNRFAIVKPLDDLADLSAILLPLHGYLSTVGYALPRERAETLADLLSPLGAFRITPVGRMQAPPPHWHHDGRPNLLDLLRFVDFEGER